jgi:hypothetical protein
MEVQEKTSRYSEGDEKITNTVALDDIRESRSGVHTDDECISEI